MLSPNLSVTVTGDRGGQRLSISELKETVVTKRVVFSFELSLLSEVSQDQ